MASAKQVIEFISLIILPKRAWRNVVKNHDTEKLQEFIELCDEIWENEQPASETEEALYERSMEIKEIAEAEMMMR